MEVLAFAASVKAVVDDRGGVSAEGFPMTSLQVTSFPANVTIPLVLALYTQGGTDYDLRRYIVATSPRGERLGTLECSWHWADNPGAPVKFWVSAPQLPVVLQAAGVCSIGLYESPDATETDHRFPLPVFKTNPLLPPQPSPTRM
jgi:hypothetical protein